MGKTKKKLGYIPKEQFQVQIRALVLPQKLLSLHTRKKENWETGDSNFLKSHLISKSLLPFD